MISFLVLFNVKWKYFSNTKQANRTKIIARMWWCIMERNVKQWWTTIPPISRKWTFTFHLNFLNTKKTTKYNVGNLCPDFEQVQAYVWVKTVNGIQPCLTWFDVIIVACVALYSLCAYHSAGPEFTSDFSGVRVTRSLILCVCFVYRCFFWPLHCLFFFDSDSSFGIFKLFFHQS